LRSKTASSSIRINIASSGEIRYKADPFAFHAETRPNTASKVYALDGYEWKDTRWQKQKEKTDSYVSPMSIYELNLLSWRRGENNEILNYRQIADELVEYLRELKYTHVELMPITEFPYDGSWGYQVTGYYAATSRFGEPKDFMYFVDTLHQANIGVILDWVPVHFCKDDHGLARFDGTDCFEWFEPYKAENNQWDTLNFDYSKPEVISFLISNAIYWQKMFHIDGLRVDAVAYMLYLDFTGKDIKNYQGGRENLDAINFLRKLNEIVFRYFPNSIMVAEESTAWPLVTAPTDTGGLGFNYKWNMGWMHDILEYMSMDPIMRRDHQNLLTFTITYCFSENYILPLSHDEVVHMKKSLLDKMPGNYEQKFANLRLLYAYMYAHPGKKLLFMGGEFGQFAEWNEWQSLDWHLLEYELHGKMKDYMTELNQLYRKTPELYEEDTSYAGYEWVEHENHKESIIAFNRLDSDGNRLLCIFNFTPVERPVYPFGVDELGNYSIVLNTDIHKWGGDTQRNKYYRAKEVPHNGKPYSIEVDIPPLGALYIRLKTKKKTAAKKPARKKKQDK
jgi:1,4-alpha-glucan branching enzyme